MTDTGHDFLPILSSLPGPRGAKGDPGAPGAAGAAAVNAYAMTTSAFVMPAGLAAATVTVTTTAWMAAGQTIFIEGAGYGVATTILSGTSLTWTANDLPANTAGGTVIAPGKKVSPGGLAYIDPATLGEYEDRIFALETTPGGAKNYYAPTAPAGGGIVVGDIWFDTNDGNRMYRWDGTGWVDIQRVLTLEDFGAGIKPVRTVSTLPSSGAIGDFVILSSDNKIYRGTGAGWTRAVAAGDLVGQVDASTFIVDGTIIAQKIGAGAITADKVGANQIVTQTANIANGVVTDAKIANLSAGKITAGDIQSVNLGYAGRIFHPSHPGRYFRSVDFGTVFEDAKVFAAGNCLAEGAGYGHATAVTAYAPGNGAWTSSSHTACPDSEGKVRVQIQGRLLGYFGKILVYCRVGSGAFIRLAAITSNDGGSAYIDCTRVIAMTATDVVRIYVAPADGDGAITPATCRVELDVTFFNW
jgi:hypothetical protein